jgi:hypothetical protein
MIEIFRTDVRRKTAARRVARQLQTQFPAYRVTFDLDDRDRILRIESSTGPVDVRGVQTALRQLAVACEVLPD